MSLRLSEILEHDAPHLGVTSRQRLAAFYDEIIASLRAGELTPEGGALPTTFNSLLALLPGQPPPLKRDKEMTDWSVENDAKHAAFLDSWRQRIKDQPTKARKPRAIAAPLHQTVARLQSLAQGGVKKAELEEAVEVFLDVYVLSQHALKLPLLERALPSHLPPEVELDGSKVAVGNDPKGEFVGLVKRTAVAKSS